MTGLFFWTVLFIVTRPLGEFSKGSRFENLSFRTADFFLKVPLPQAALSEPDLGRAATPFAVSLGFTTRYAPAEIASMHAAWIA